MRTEVIIEMEEIERFATADGFLPLNYSDSLLSILTTELHKFLAGEPSASSADQVRLVKFAEALVKRFLSLTISSMDDQAIVKGLDAFSVHLTLEKMRRQGKLAVEPATLSQLISDISS